MLRDLFSLFPAYAGVIPTHGANHPVTGTFPRICGGDPQVDTRRQVHILLFPAYAGVIPPEYNAKIGGVTFPRICGGDPHIGQFRKRQDCFSPHMRG